MLPRLPGLAFVVACLLLVAVALAPRPADAITFTDSLFIAEDIAPAVTWTTPTGLAYLPGGRLLVIEKRGRVYSVMNGIKSAQPLLNLESEVLNEGDRGLLGIAVDPNYVTNHFVYLLYTVDPDSNDIETNDDAFSRLSRFQVSFADSTSMPYASRAVLFGHTWTSGAISASSSHTVGCLRFGTDGTLLVSIGDGGQFNVTDAGGVDPGAFGAGRTDPLEDIGAFRAQYLQSLAGKLLRIDPATGLGLPSNPFYESANPGSAQSRVWCYGLRNPFRFALHPATGSTDPSAGQPGSAFIGDVGWTAWEETNVATTGGVNFGWPCYEGLNPQDGYQAATPPHHDCATIGTVTNPSPATSPIMTWHHLTASLSTPPGLVGNAATACVFYTGGRYPIIYAGRFFFSDYGADWINTAVLDGNQVLVSTSPWATSVGGPVDLAQDPVNGELIVVSITNNQVLRIRYAGTVPNGEPVTVAKGTPLVGIMPLTVSFSSAGTFDPNGDPVTMTWLFGDGEGASGPAPQHTYTKSGSFLAVLNAADDDGSIGRDTVNVVVLASSAFPTTPVLDNFNRANGPIGSPWVGITSGLTINNNMLWPSCCSPSTVWSSQSFGPNQEAFIRFQAISTSAPEQDLMLKVQGLSYTTGHIEVRYDAALHAVRVATYVLPGGWTQRASFPTTMAVGDVMGARAFANGVIQVIKNGAVLGQTSTGNWPFAANGGYLGLTIAGAQAARLDDFGGGNVVFSTNTPPAVSIVSPLPGEFYVEGEPLTLNGIATDGQQEPGSLPYEWSVNLHHNNHVHPNTVVLSGPTTGFTPENHDDGTGVWLQLKLSVTDAEGLSDTTSIAIFPEIDLVAAPALISPDPPVTGTQTFVNFWIHNRGHMPAQLSRWRLNRGNEVLAEGDTLVPPLDSVRVQRIYPAGSFAAGPLTLRFVADTLGVIPETDESNNGVTIERVVTEGGAVDVEAAPLAFSLGEVRPNPSPSTVALSLALPRVSRVEFEVFDAQGRVALRRATRAYSPGRHELRWDGRLNGREAAPAGLYWARVTVDGARYARRFVIVK
ncbi:MAG: PKD domain-containing protein [Candidatus Eisenbacteria bacterium]|uniref:PKD domain-containing protein n=1 Tax=Eiseniibacteriota bacterium TaxID=2212470 RepID=A0A849SGB3_UNCEI|nr:PKD domain-containing protein [Candidatus Eisenbacteria bacterium]